MANHGGSAGPEGLMRLRQSLRGLMVTLYSRPDPSTEVALLEKIARLEAEIAAREGSPAAVDPTPTPSLPAAPPRSRFLGAKTTGLRVKPTLNMHPVPTGVYNLLDPENDPLLTVTVANDSRDIRRVCVRVYIEGLSAQAVRTIELEPRKEVELKLLPTLLPDRARDVTEIQRATLHILAEDLDGKPELHETLTVVCLARGSSFNSVRRPDTGELVDLSHYYGAWVTPHVEAVQERVRHAAELMAGGQIWGYQGDPESVTSQVRSLFESLKAAGVFYVNSVIDFGVGAGQASQRTRLPRESLALRSANCIDGAVLMASLLEAASLNPALVLVPGHAFVAWEVWDGADEWEYLETTMIGRHDFEAACASGRRQFENASRFGGGGLVVHRLADLRARGIWPME